MPRTIFLLSVVLFVAGDILGALYGESLLLPSFVVFFLCLIFGSILFGKKGLFTVLFFISFLLGHFLGSSVAERHREEYNTLSSLTDNFMKKTVIEGMLEKELYRRDRSRVFLLRIDNFDNFDKNTEDPAEKAKNLTNTGKTSIFLEIPSNLTLSVGDRVEVTGKIKPNISFPLTGFSKYAFLQGGYGYLFAPTFTREVVANKDIISTIAGSWQILFERGFPRDVAGTLLGMTIGSFELLSNELKASFIASGTSHILVVSGSNIALLIVFLTFFLKYLYIGKVLRISVVSFCIIFYVFLVGIEVAVIRATIMGIISYIAVDWGEKVSSRSTLALALIVLTIAEPLGPLYDAGFGLSFSATLGIILFQAPIKRFFEKYRVHTVLSSSLAITLGASIGSLPLLLYHFSEVPVWSIAANILVAGFLGWILFSGIIYAVFSLVSQSITYYFGFLVYLPTYIVIGISRMFDSGYILRFSPDIALMTCLFLLGMMTFFFVWED